MTHEQKISRWIGPGKIGTEIGPGTAPIPGLAPPPIYLDCFKTFAASECKADYYGHACALPFHDHSLDYVLASHVLEHVANPVAALAEWCRVLRPGGIIYLIVPDRRATWEHGRGLTPVDHMLDDYVRGTTACDATHIDEFVLEGDWSLFSPETPADAVEAKKAELAKAMHWAVDHGQDINIHFHTFEPGNLHELLERLARLTRPPTPPNLESDGSGAPALTSIPRFNWEIVDFAERFPSGTPNGVLAVLRVQKGWRIRAELEARRLRTQGEPRAVLKDDAQPFAEWAAKTTGLGSVR